MRATAATPIPYDALSYLRANAAVRGDALAVHDEGEELTFEALHRAVLSLAADLRERGVGPGDVVAVALPNVWRYVALEIAVPAVGAVCHRCRSASAGSRSRRRSSVRARR